LPDPGAFSRIARKFNESSRASERLRENLTATPPQPVGLDLEGALTVREPPEAPQPKGLRMAQRTIQMREPRKDATDELMPPSQNKRPEIGRFLLQVDRQTKQSFAELELAEAAGKAIKKSYPILAVSIYDSAAGQNMQVTL
jgi:hypothetical protein